MNENNKKITVPLKDFIKVEKLLKKVKKKNLIKSHIEAFDKNPVELEKHKGKSSYFYN